VTKEGLLGFMLQKRCRALKCMREDRNRIGKRVLLLLVPGFFLLLVASAPARSQSNSSGTPATPQPASPTAPAKTDARPTGDFAGLTLTDDQKAKIAQIRQHAKLRREAVINDDRLSQSRKVAMLEGLQRIETSEIFKVLTPEQQTEVRKRMVARRAAEQQEQQQGKQAVPAPQ
jgi:Spy/CpxP family protein refolding chaperone